jgi:hypothetical protein
MVNFVIDFSYKQLSSRTNLDPEVDMSDLTWEQKEQVLRALFIRMNTKKSDPPLNE